MPSLKFGSLCNSDSTWKQALEEFSKISKELNETDTKINYEKITCLEGKYINIK